MFLKDGSYNADIFMLNGEVDSSEFQNLVDKYRISNKYAIPRNWFTSYSSKNNEPNYGTIIKI